MKKYFLFFFTSFFVMCSLTRSYGGVNEDLFEASRRGNVKAVESALKNGANIDELIYDIDDTDEVYTPLHIATIKNHKEVVQTLIRHGADLNIQSEPTYSAALIYAVDNQNLEITKLLLESGADPNIFDTRGGTALQYACYYDNFDIIKLLVEYKANVNAHSLITSHEYVDTYGYTALMRASESGNVGAVKLLLANNADVSLTNEGAGTAYMAAKSEGHNEVMALLAEHAKKRKFTAEELKRMSVFLSNFSEIGMFSFTESDVIHKNDTEMALYFGVYHNYINNFKSRIKECEGEMCEHGELFISSTDVEESIDKYFNSGGYPIENRSRKNLFYEETGIRSGNYYFNKIDFSPILYVRVESAELNDEGNIKMKGKLYNSKNKSEIHGTIEALARTHYWKGKATWSIIKMAKFDN